METKMPLISYFVTCKYKENSVGLKTLHKQFFSNSNFSEARKTAFEYVEAAKELMHKNELMINRKRHKNPAGVYIRNKNAFEDGIQIHMRINEDFSGSGMHDQKDSTYLIAAFHPLNDDLRQRINAGRIVEKKYYKILHQSPFEDDDFMIDYKKFEQEKSEIVKLASKPITEIEFVPFTLDYNITDIFQSISAFANCSGGTIIFGQDENFSYNFANRKMNNLSNQVWRKIETVFPEMLDYIIIFERECTDKKFIEIQVIPTPFDCLLKGDYYTRTIHGNVMDLEKSL